MKYMTIKFKFYIKEFVLGKYVIGFDLGGTSLKYGIGNSTEGIIYFNSKKHSEKSIKGLKTLFSYAIEDIRKHSDDFYAICIASPGIINKDSGMILGSVPNLPFLKNQNLKELLSKLTGLPVVIDNDANIMTYGESLRHGKKSVLGITIGTGIGTGFVSDGNIFNGINWKAMEAGHTIVMPEGRKCMCGKQGCLEAYASANSILRIFNENFPETVKYNIGEIFYRCNQNDNYRTLINEIYKLFAISVSNLIMILDTDVVSIGGGVIEIHDFDFEYLKTCISKNLTEEYHNVIIEKAIFGNKAGVYGSIILGERSIDV